MEVENRPESAKQQIMVKVDSTERQAAILHVFIGEGPTRFQSDTVRERLPEAPRAFRWTWPAEPWVQAACRTQGRLANSPPAAPRKQHGPAAHKVAGARATPSRPLPPRIVR